MLMPTDNNASWMDINILKPTGCDGQQNAWKQGQKCFRQKGFAQNSLMMILHPFHSNPGSYKSRKGKNIEKGEGLKKEKLNWNWSAEWLNDAGILKVSKNIPILQLQLEECGQVTDRRKLMSNWRQLRWLIKNNNENHRHKGRLLQHAGHVTRLSKR